MERRKIEERERERERESPWVFFFFLLTTRTYWVFRYSTSAATARWLISLTAKRSVRDWTEEFFFFYPFPVSSRSPLGFTSKAMCLVLFYYFFICSLAVSDVSSGPHAEYLTYPKPLGDIRSKISVVRFPGENITSRTSHVTNEYQQKFGGGNCPATPLERDLWIGDDVSRKLNREPPAPLSNPWRFAKHSTTSARIKRGPWGLISSSNFREKKSSYALILFSLPR